MKHAYSVGMGFRKHTFEDAVIKCSDGDVILVDPGVYTLPDWFEVGSLKIIGKGDGPADVVLKTSFVLRDSSTFELNNVKVLTESEKRNCIYAGNFSKIKLSNVIIESVVKNYPSVYLKSAELQSDSSRFIHRDTRKTPSIFASEKSVVTVKQVDMDSLRASHSEINIEKSQIRVWTILSKNSEMQADYLYTQNTEENIYILSVLSNSIGSISNLILPSGYSIVRVVSSKLDVKRNNIDDKHRLACDSSEKAIVEVWGIEYKKTEKQQETQNAKIVPKARAKFQPAEKDENKENNSFEKQNHKNERAIDEIDKMVGLRSVKKTVHDFIDMAVFNKQRAQQGLEPISQSYHSLFLGNPGTGKTTVARLVARAMFEEGVMPSDNYVETSRQNLVAQHVGGTAIQTQSILEEATGGVLFIDEAYTLYQEGGTNWGQEAIDTILKYMEDHRDELMIIFAGYTKQMKDFINMNPGLSSRAPNLFDFEDYTPEEISEIGVKQLLDKSFDFDKVYYSAAVIKSYKRENASSNGRWVRNFNDKLIRVMAKNSIKNKSHGISQILNSDIDELTGGSDKDKANETDVILEQLNEMVGLESVKSYVANLTATIVTNKSLSGKIVEEKPTYHMVFSGNPGTGKTTVARLIARLFYDLGILPKDTVLEVSRADLVGRYIGQSEELTKKAVRDAMGGVLFIDEAYQLTSSGSGNDFGKQVVETLITELENNRENFIVIFAGYTQQMNDFLNTNPGLKSRIPLNLNFQDYSASEIAEIVKIRLSKNWKFNKPLLQSLVEKAYSGLPSNEKSNGRWARNLTDKIITHHKIWLSKNLSVADPTNIVDSILVECIS